MADPISPEPFVVSTPGDLEVAVLDQSHDLMSSIINPLLYRVSGDEGQQQASFHTAETFSLFSIRVGELISEARGNVAVEGAPSNLSLLAGLGWLAPRLREPSSQALAGRTTDLARWLDGPEVCRFWCSGLQSEFAFTVTRKQLWSVHANNSKHSFLRLQNVTRQLSAWTVKAGHPVTGSDILHVLESFSQWLDGYCVYYSTWAAELIGLAFAELNRVIIERWEANGRSNDSGAIIHPEGASEFFQQLHTSVLVMRRYSAERIADLTPSTAPSLRKAYHA